ncbi:MAG: NosD domain-containing protein, partial [Thermoplasmatota archaeon]
MDAILKNNSFNRGIWLDGYQMSHYVHTFQNNDVNGYSLYYYLNQSSLSLDGMGNVGQIILVDCDHIDVTNTTLWYGGIEIAFSHTINIACNTMHSTYYGTFISAGSSSLSIENNSMDDCSYGVHIWSSDYDSYPCTNIDIRDNDIYNLWNSGIYAGYASYVAATNNTIASGWIGMELYYRSFNCTLASNTLSDNYYRDISLRYDCHDNLITGNQLESTNDYGIYIYGSSYSPVHNNVITLNTIAHHDYGIYINEHAYGHHIYHNSFIDNTQQAYDASGTYTAHYTGYGFWDGTWTWTPVTGDGYWYYYFGYGGERVWYTEGTAGVENHWLNKTMDLSSAAITSPVYVECRLDYDGTPRTYWFTVDNGSYAKHFPIAFTVGPGHQVPGGNETFTFDISEFAGQSGITMGFHVNFTSDGTEALGQWWLYVNYTQVWDNGYPSGGNYWNDFDEPTEGAYDNYRGVYQNQAGGDRIVDGSSLNPYLIPPNTVQDTYPLTHPWGAIPPLPSFTYTPLSPVIDEIITFSDASFDLDGTIVNWTWDFGDTTTSYEQNPQHQYTNSGVHSVTLTVYDDTGLYDSLTQPIAIQEPSAWNNWDNEPHMYNMNEGNVGIGTDTPTDKLHVN